jgi:hypothetical protein
MRGTGRGGRPKSAYRPGEIAYFLALSWRLRGSASDHSQAFVRIFGTACPVLTACAKCVDVDGIITVLRRPAMCKSLSRFSFSVRVKCVLLWGILNSNRATIRRHNR